jgi:hypothetical protein
VSTGKQPFAVSRLTIRDLKALHESWQKLRRGQAEMPFADDIRLGGLRRPEAALLIDVIEKPLRFRFAIVGDGIARRYGAELAGLFADDVPGTAPLDYLLSQSAATVEGREPTLYSGTDYARLLLPLWGDGRITMLLGGVAFRASKKRTRARRLKESPRRARKKRKP